MNNTATTKNETFPKLSVQASNAYHAAALVDQAKLVEAGQLDPSTLQIGPAGADAKKKLQVLAAVTGGTFGSLTDESPMYAQIKEDAEELGTHLTFPLDRSLAPYSSALLAYNLSLVGSNLDAPKSPYADNFPGPVPLDAPRVETTTITVDFDYSTFDYLRQGTVPKNWISTGLYAPAGEYMTIHVPEGTTGLDVQIGAHTDNLTSQNIWKRIPVVTQRKTLVPGDNVIRSPYGGLLYLIPTKPQAGVSKNITIKGGVKAPYYVLGQTTNEEWRDTISKHSAPWAELQGRRVILTLPSEYVRSLADPKALLEKWDQIVDYTDEVAGLSPDAALPHRSTDLPFRYVADRQISAGFMHAGYPIMFQIDPSAAHAVDIERVTRNGWGFWHETGHEYQQGAWNWDVTGEVTVNIYSLYVQQKFGNPSNLLTRNAQGKDFYDRAFEYMATSDPNTTVYGKSGQDLFVNLVMFRQLSLAYGWDFYVDLHRAYRELPAAELPQNNQAEIDTFVVMASKTAGEDLTEFFDKWFLKYTPSTVKAQIAALNLPKPAQPIWQLRESDGIEAPVIVLDSDSEQEWSRAEVTVTITNPTPVEEGSGLRNQYKLGETGTWTEYKEPVAITAEGETKVFARVRQLSGVTSDEVQATVKIDRTAPNIEATVAESVYGDTPIAIPVQVTDMLSGVKSARVSLDGSPLAAPYTIVPNDLAKGTHELKITAEDHAGNVSEKIVRFHVVKAASVQDLYDAVEHAKAEGWITNQGILQALKSHIKGIEKGNPNDPAAYQSLEHFIRAQTGKHIDEQAAAEFTRIIAELKQS
ncbi:M60 family metallopeptidase [Paenibacillus sp. 1001270B_150601_E10]|uniref:M60 family metallopeptidase n=1 Tax=Paenibacillus sp. 1001270B_150601_E10 TaxID=2787079 RepID=UPI001E520928|nr:M60 family metallopeptidase [Paenibacillus sp. 1001270B_150601_E10]